MLKWLKSAITPQENKNDITLKNFVSKKLDFIAIDFETANSNRVSACAIGVSLVVESKIVLSKRIFIIN